MRILKTWQQLNRIPLIGRWLFSRYVGRMAPYSGSIYASVEQLEKGYARVSMQDRKCLRNPFHSVHAIAMANLGELASGLAVLTTIPAHKRGIVTAFKVEFFKKARGTLRCDCRTAFPDCDGPFDVTAEILNSAGEKVAQVLASWTLGPNKVNP